MNIINEIRLSFNSAAQGVKSLSHRNVFSQIDWNERLIGILGPKGTGKTTLLFQRFLASEEHSLYISLDHPLATYMPILELAHQFWIEGGVTLLLDEVHKYPNWSSELKNIYDTLPKLKIVFSGSSAVRINSQKGDLSRRASIYSLPVLSFREFLQLEKEIYFPIVKLKDLFENHHDLARQVVESIPPIPLFKKYLEHGAYPFYREGLARYLDKLRNTVIYSIETDLVQVHQLDPQNIPKLKKLLQLLASAVPFTPNISALAQSLEISRASVLRYLQILEYGGIIALLDHAGRGYQKLSKPEKVYLDNTNLLYAFSGQHNEIGTLRETFCMNQFRSAGYKLNLPFKGDFLVENTFALEVGGKNKKDPQLRAEERGFILRDDIEIGTKNFIPLWLVGFLY